MVAFDLNRDGSLDTSSLDSDELIHNFEKHVTLDGRSLRPRDRSRRRVADADARSAKPLPPRTPLHAGLRLAPLRGRRGCWHGLRAMGFGAQITQTVVTAVCPLTALLSSTRRRVFARVAARAVPRGGPR